MPITLGSNIAALAAQRQLSKGSGDLARVFERLSSGMRINRASDDAAGLSLAAGLTAGSRIYNQAVRNLNDGISLLNVTEGALEALTALGQRGQELAEQASSGTYSVNQRLAMQQESDAIVSEYNRILQTTEFNGLKPLTSAAFSLSLQAGIGANGSISSTIGAQLARTAGDGTLAAGVSYAAAFPGNVSTADINGDGILDLLIAGSAASANFYLGNGDGTFRAVTSLASTNTLASLEAADINNDGIADLVGIGGSVGSSVSVYLGTGGGGFAAEVTFNGAVSSRDIVLQDVNSDNNLDLVQINTPGAGVNVLLGNGNGSFKAADFYAATPAASLGSLIVSDINGDGVVDIVDTNAGAADTVGFYFGNGDGTFRARTSISVGDNPAMVELADFNRDGKADLVTADQLSGTVSILLGNGDGTFSARVTYAVGGGPNGLSLADMNGDGFADIIDVDSSSDTIRVLLGNGDGTFGSASTTAVLANATRMTVGDFNRDGVVDAVAAGGPDGAFTVHLGNTRRITSVGYANLTTTSEAQSAIESWAATLSRIAMERGAVGAAQSRIEFATATARSTADNFKAAASRILDIDVAQETAAMVRLKILQEAATSMLAHATQDSKIVLKLLS